jgi:hypothetical protein
LQLVTFNKEQQLLGLQGPHGLNKRVLSELRLLSIEGLSLNQSTPRAVKNLQALLDPTHAA